MSSVVKTWVGQARRHTTGNVDHNDMKSERKSYRHPNIWKKKRFHDAQLHDCTRCLEHGISPRHTSRLHFDTQAIHGGYPMEG